MTKNKMTTKAVISTAVLTLAISIVPTGNAFSNSEFGLIQAEASTATHVAKGNLNLRSGGSLKDKIILQIPKGGKIEYISGSGIWYKVKYGTTTGYVHSDYITKIETVAPETPKATHFAKSNVNLRTGASTKHEIVLVIPRNAEVSYISKSGIWYKVKYGTKTGYVHSDYLAKIGAAEPSKYPAPSTDTPGKYVEDILIVNKKYALPSTYNPGVNATAKKALDAMIADAKKQSVTLKITSSYRSYWYQNTLYNNYVEKHGKAKADRFSARPGHSEHQTGLAFDLGGVNQAHWFEESFANTKEGKWLASNAHKYGFHLRYQKGKEDITGYMFEPWHFRYIGEANATKIKTSGKTLEEYFDIPGK
ncbi:MULTISPECIES: D-alanyl-D-alanine carboxypeptidase family protein [unclassified Planococcus (in: firmicutes)]|uniref:D-alanyl-D-alanine carboxypeptidase family protein n=1 Tax=unclassified Planococcus (in: firmicutes) TaxID=2662419 RepID=UPI0020B1C5CE|nr:MULTISPECIES: D-alanyl-D-alanine carboxypeptidase family protein [unclassified Planococcus (in: firmicutes)]